MSKIGYSFKIEDENGVAKVTGRALRISPKWSIELAREVRGKKLTQAKNYLDDIIEQRRSLPLKRFKKGVAHRSDLVKADAGRYPKKASQHFLELLESAEKNAEYKGMDVDKLYVKHIIAQRGPIIRGFRSRAYGRASPSNTQTTHVQIILEER
ncbi:50S ribosomal protein L22 [archaeon BMS3Bbin15]|nr:50S ribosomal protein L22 [archaeon BMS3Bbin15]